MAIKRLFIANRGEIAVRIVKAAQAMGIHTIQAYSEADDSMLAVRMADEAVCIGAAQSALSYLNVEGIVEAAKSTNADAVHPGYGFLAENADFVRALDAAGIVFVGPSADTIDRMGDKVSARQAAQAAGVPVVPGSKGRLDTTDDAIKLAADIGYPVMIKAAAGGGGKGIRIATNEEDLRKMAPQAQAEAKASFGDGGLYLERAIQSPRHIEVQILGDGVDAIHCFERECSMQRRRQKVWEEAGAICLDEATRSHLCDTAVALAKAVKYRGAGTLEYLYDANTKEFYFIEMNTRIQVEHPVTEMITGIDLVQEMLRVAGGSSLSMTQNDVKRQGHAIEVRLNAEDPLMQFMPCPGQVGAMTIPEGDGIRFDHFLYEGYHIPPFYDSLLGKLIVHAETREAAIDLMITALNGLSIDGIKTTKPLHLALANSAAVRSDNFHTQWLEPWLASGNLKS
jgi:acetyl-CoA carboxylase biotin carboxylase subunit